MTDNVITLRGNKVDDTPKERLIITCSHCDCQSLFMYDGGVVECSNCERVLSEDPTDPNEVMWRRVMPPVPEDRSSVPTNIGNIVIKRVPENFAKHDTIRKLTEISKDGDTLAFVMGYKKDGAGHFWFDYSTEEDKQNIISDLKKTIKYLEDKAVTWAGEKGV